MYWEMVFEGLKRVYVYAPAGIKTGGPELLHQLCSTLQELNIENYIVYFNAEAGKEQTVAEYRKYLINKQDEKDVIDDEGSIIVVPETHVAPLFKFKKAKKAIWWLSVGNYVDWAADKIKMLELEKLDEVKRSILLADFHFCQSYYSYQFLKKYFKFPESKLFMLSDYINDQFGDNENLARENWVVYSPAKGMETTTYFIKKYPEICWKPIQNMTREGVKNLLEKSKVYIDFGGFPGKDRIPREAALSGCCVMIGEKGSACYMEDFPILSQYRIQNPIKEEERVMQIIKNCLANYDTEIVKFELYRESILNEKNIFVNEVKSIFS